MRSSNEFIRQLSKRHANLSVLVIADSFPDSLSAHVGSILFFGSEFPALPLQSRDFHFIAVTSADDIEREAALSATRPRHQPYDIVFIDHNHRFDQLIRHLNAAMTVAAASALFLFDDAVPPTITMAGPEPRESWWVGEVWMLPQILRPANETFMCLTADLPPTGLIAAAGFAAPDLAQSAATYEILSAVDNEAALRHYLPLTDPKHMFARADTALGVISMPNAIRLDPGGEADTDMFARRLVSPSLDWVKSPPLFCADLSAAGHDVTRIMQSDREAAAKYIDSFNNVHLVGFNGLIKDSKYFDHWLNTDAEDLTRIGASHGDYANRWTGIVLLNDAPFLPRERLTGAIEIAGPVMFGTPDEPDNWGMWLILALPSLWEFLENRGRYDKFMAAAQHPWQQKLFTAAGLRTADLIAHDRAQVYLCQDVSIIRKSYRDMYITADEKQCFQSFRRLLAPDLTKQGGMARRIFVSRITRSKRSDNYRGLINEAALIAALEPLGFQVIEPEFLSFAEQVAVFSAADVVVGLGGAGMFNVVFCKADALVITIESSMSFLDAHTNIFASLGLNYGVILGEEDVTDPRPSQRRWSLNIAGAVDQIRKVLT